MATDYDIVTVEAFEGTASVGSQLGLSSVGDVIEEKVSEGWEFLTSTEAIEASRYDVEEDTRLHGKIFKVTFRRPKSFLSDPANAEIVARIEHRAADKLAFEAAEGERRQRALEQQIVAHKDLGERAALWLNLNALAFLVVLFVAMPLLQPLFFETTVIRAWVVPGTASISVWLLWIAVGAMSYVSGRDGGVGTFWASAGILGVIAKLFGSIIIPIASILVVAIAGILGAMFGSHH